MSQTLLVNKEDFAEVALVNIKEDAVEEGCIRLKLGPWALTANNITYMLTGDKIGYWHYFNPSDYGLQMDEGDGIDWGRMPVWGYGEVIESKCEDVKIGQQVYGFLPIADPTMGLTSERNKAFVEGTGFYDGVHTYDAITDMNPDVKTVIVDMAGNGDVMETVLEHFEENVQAKARIAEWGGAGFNARLGERWLPFCNSASGWLTIEKQDGIEPLLKTYKDMLDGTAAPDKGYLFSL